MPKIIRILRSCSMKIFCTFSTVNISKLNFWLVICIAKNFIWTTLKVIFSIFRFFCTLRFQIYKYCAIITNHTSMESWFITLINWPLWLVLCINIGGLTSLRCRRWARPRRWGWRAPPVGPGSALSGCPAHRACCRGCGHRSCPSLCCTDPPPSAARPTPACCQGSAASGPLWTSALRTDRRTRSQSHNTRRLTGARATEDRLHWCYTVNKKSWENWKVQGKQLQQICEFSQLLSFINYNYKVAMKLLALNFWVFSIFDCLQSRFLRLYLTIQKKGQNCGF